MSADSELTARQKPTRRDVLAWGLIVTLLSGHFVLGVLTARSLSVTHDEYWHLPVGILNLRTGRFDYEPLNPPLTRVVSAIATTVAVPGTYRGPVPVKSDPSHYGLQFLRLMGDQHQTCFIWGRVANLLFSVATGIILAIWSWQWWGRVAACVAVLLWCTEPTVLAHASLVTPDAGLTCFTVAYWFALWHYFRHPTLRQSMLCGVLLGLAQLTKYTAVILIPLTVTVWIVWRLCMADPVYKRTRMWGQLALLLLICHVVLISGYLGEGMFQTLNQIQPTSRTVTGWIKAMPILGQIPMPFPKSYLVGLDAQKLMLEGAHPVYLNRTWSTSGHVTYFLWALWYKLPHVWQLLCVGGIVRILMGGGTLGDRQRLGFISLPVLLLLGISSLSSMQLGIRYILPVFPFLALITGTWFSRMEQVRWPNWQRHLLCTIVLTSPLSMRFHPQHLAYFNEAAGGPASGGEHLLDSNLDWGQDLLELKDYVSRHPHLRWNIAYFGSVPPGELGLQYDLPAKGQPMPGAYAISVNYVYGRPGIVYDQHGISRAVTVGEFSDFLGFEPTRRIGASILVYQIKPSDILRHQQSRGGL